MAAPETRACRGYQTSTTNSVPHRFHQMDVPEEKDLGRDIRDPAEPQPKNKDTVIGLNFFTASQ